MPMVFSATTCGEVAPLIPSPIDDYSFQTEEYSRRGQRMATWEREPSICSLGRGDLFPVDDNASCAQIPLI